MLQRIYGTAFFKKEELKHHLQMLEEAKERDHRKIGKELELFTTSQKLAKVYHFGYQMVQQFVVLLNVILSIKNYHLAISTFIHTSIRF